MNRGDAPTFDLDAVFLTSGYTSDVGGRFLSVLEAAALFGGEVPSFKPDCVSPVLTVFVGMWSEGLNGPVKQRRQELKHFVPRLARSASVEAEAPRWWMMADWLVRECTAAVLLATDHEDLRSAALELQALPTLRSGEAAIEALPTLRDVGALVAERHAERRPDSYLPSRLSWSPAKGRIGALAVWNAVVFRQPSSLGLPRAASNGLDEVTRKALEIVVQGIGLVAEPAARAEWFRREGLPPGWGLGFVPGASYLNTLELRRRRHSEHVYRAGMAALTDLVDAQINSGMGLLDRLLELTDEVEQR